MAPSHSSLGNYSEESFYSIFSRRMQKQLADERKRDINNAEIIAKVQLSLEMGIFSKAVEICDEALARHGTFPSLTQYMELAQHCLKTSPGLDEVKFMIILLQGHFGKTLAEMKEKLLCFKKNGHYTCPNCNKNFDTTGEVSNGVHDFIAHGGEHFGFLINFQILPYHCPSTFCKSITQNFGDASQYSLHLENPGAGHEDDEFLINHEKEELRNNG